MSDRSNTPRGSGDAEDGFGADSSGGGSSDRRAWIVVGALAALVIILGVWLWAAGGDDTEDIAGIDDDGAATSTTTTTTTVTTADPRSTTTSEGPSTTQSTLPDEAPGGIRVPEGASTDPVEVPPGGVEPTAITAIRTARHEGFDRVVFEFDQAVPGYEVGYARRPIREDGSGNEVTVDGRHVVTVRMNPASVVRFTDTGYDEIYTGPDRLPGEGATITEVVQVGDFEGYATWAVGLADEVDFAVSTLESPARLVVDFVNH